MSVHSKIALRYAAAHRLGQTLAGASVLSPALLLFAAGAHAAPDDMRAAVEPASHATARAEQAGAPVRRVVRYDDLDLSKQVDASALYARLQAAAEIVCGRYEIRDLRAMQQHRDCTEDAVTDAVAKVNHAVLSSLHQETGRMRVAQRRNEVMPRT